MKEKNINTYKVTCGVCGYSIKLEESELRYYSPEDVATRPVLGGELTADDGPATDVFNCEKCPCILFPQDYAAKKPLIEKIEPRPKRKRAKRKKNVKKKSAPVQKKEEKKLDPEEPT